VNTLILYESKHGTVAHAVSILAESLNGEVVAVKLSDGNIPPLAGFDAVILGGSIYFGKIQKTMSRFIDKNKQELLGKKLGLFICGAHPDQKEREKELQLAYPKELMVQAAAADILGYQIHIQEFNRLEAIIVKSILGLKEDKDGLDRGRIEAFARKMNK
jgi:menaquinone-dependent protoporphyrinogen oxidase